MPNAGSVYAAHKQTTRGAGGTLTMDIIKSREELRLAGLFARTLQNLIALSSPEHERPRPTAAQVLNATDGETPVSPTLFRLIQLVLLPDILGSSAGQVLYLAAKQFSSNLELASIQDLKSWFSYMSLGELEVELDEEKVLVKLSHCLTCHRLHSIGAPLCGFERGLVDGVLERITGGEVITKETLCWGLGDTVCQFEAFTADHGGYLYPEEGRHVEVQRRLLAGLADQSEIALENLHLVTERQTAETRDPLTSMYNFRHLREHGAVELARARRYKRQVAFVMLDLDDYEEVNERVGRDTGDMVLKHWAEELRRQVRTCDFCCRYGSDEFLLVLPETADNEADQALERILHAMKEVRTELGGSTFALTATAGVATFPDDGNLVEELVAKATTTMYIAKSKGPGQVGFYSPPTEA